MGAAARCWGIRASTCSTTAWIGWAPSVRRLAIRALALPGTRRTPHWIAGRSSFRWRSSCWRGRPLFIVAMPVFLWGDTAPRFASGSICLTAPATTLTSSIPTCCSTATTRVAHTALVGGCVQLGAGFWGRERGPAYLHHLAVLHHGGDGRLPGVLAASVCCGSPRGAASLLFFALMPLFSNYAEKAHHQRRPLCGRFGGAGGADGVAAGCGTGQDHAPSRLGATGYLFDRVCVFAQRRFAFPLAACGLAAIFVARDARARGRRVPLLDRHCWSGGACLSSTWLLRVCRSCRALDITR